MRPKIAGWKEGVISVDLKGFGNAIHKKGSVVRYKRFKTVPDKDGFKLTEYEWHYLDTDNRSLIRTMERIIDGIPHIKEPYI